MGIWQEGAGLGGWPRISKPAKVGAVRFQRGVSARLVVEAAQRQFEHDVTPEKESERIASGEQQRQEIMRLSAELQAGLLGKVPVGRELLNEMMAFTREHDSGRAGVLRGQIGALLAKGEKAQPTKSENALLQK